MGDAVEDAAVRNAGATAAVHRSGAAGREVAVPPLPARRQTNGRGFRPIGTGWLPWLIGAPLLLLLALPLIALVWRAIGQEQGFSAATWATLRQAIGLSLTTSTVSMLMIVGLGTPLAYALARRRFHGSRAIDLLIDLPIVLPPSVAGITLLLAFGRFGLVGRWLDAAGVTIGFTTAAVVLAQAFVGAPFFVRAAAAGFARVERDLEEAAGDLGAPPMRVFRTVTLPIAFPTLLAGALLAWARALGEFGATIMFAGNLPGVTQTMPLAIYARFGAGDLETALLLSVALLLSSVLVLAGVRLLAGRPVGPWG